MKRIMTGLLAVILMAGCSNEVKQPAEGTYGKITPKQALKIIEEHPECVIVDASTPEEFEVRHVFGAISLPNDQIGAVRPKELSDPEEIILVYCTAGTAGKEAAQKLADFGYRNVYEFGYITAWEGATVSKSKVTNDNDVSLWVLDGNPVSVHYDRMWIYAASADSDDPEMITAIADAIRSMEVMEKTDMSVTDYTDIVTFTFEDGSTQRYEFEGQAWVKSGDERYLVTGLGTLRSLLEEMLQNQENE